MRGGRGFMIKDKSIDNGWSHVLSMRIGLVSESIFSTYPTFHVNKNIINFNCIFCFVSRLFIAMSTSLNLRMEIHKKSNGKNLDGMLLIYILSC